MSPQQPSMTDRDFRQKTALFCPACGHESDITGDWVIHTENARRVYECPVCDTTLTETSA